MDNRRPQRPGNNNGNDNNNGNENSGGGFGHGPYFNAITGRVIAINDVTEDREDINGCSKLMMVEDDEGQIINFHISPATYFMGRVKINVGDMVTAYYDNNTPVVMIYPPQYHAEVVALSDPSINMKVDYFDSTLVSADGTLQLNVAPGTEVVLENGQDFSGSLENRNLAVMYGATTRSIPAQTTPYQIVVLCMQKYCND